MKNTITHPITQARLTITTAKEAGLGSHYGAWMVWCDTHQEYTYASSQAAAEQARVYPDFCPQCSKLLPPKSQMPK